MVGAPAGDTMRSTSITISTTISRRTTTIDPSNISVAKAVRVNGSITRNTGEMPSTGIRERPRSMGSSVPGPGPGQAHRTPGALAAAQDREAVEGLKLAIAAVAEAVKVA